MKYLFLIFILFSNILLGAEQFVDEFPIFVFGDVQSIESAFIFIRKLLEDAQFVEDIVITISLYLSGRVAWGIYATQSMRSVTPNYLYLTTGILALTGALNVTVHIEDQRTQIDATANNYVNYAKVDDIPYPIALITSLASTISLTLQEKVEDATTSVDSSAVSYQAIGFARAFGDTMNIIKHASFSGNPEASKFGKATTVYIADCVLNYAALTHNDIGAVIKNPQMDLYKAIDPTTLNIAGDDFMTEFENSTISCEDLYTNELSGNKYTSVMQSIQDRIDKTTSGKLSETMESLGVVANAKITDSLISGTVGQAHAYIANISAIGPIQKAIRNVSGGTEAVSGQDLANSITLASTKARLQSDGTGQFKWMAEILPFAFHFFLGIIYAISAFVMIIAVAIGYEKGLVLIMNYAQGLLVFEFIRVALIYANNSVNQYSQHHAFDQLAALGSNPATVMTLPQHLDQLATMTGVAGILGVSAVFMIPTMVFTGKVAMASSAIGGLGGKYQGNDAETSKAAASKQRAMQDSHERHLQQEDFAKASLGKLGMTAPKGMGASEYYASLQQDLNAMGNSWAATNAGGSKLSSAAHGGSMMESGKIESMATVGNNTSRAQHASSGTASGHMQVGSIEANVDALDTHGGSTLQSSAKSNELAKIDSSVGKAMGIDANKDKYGKDAYVKSSEYGEMSQMAQTQGAIKNYGGDLGKMQDVVGADSQIKAASQEKVTDKLLQKGGATAGVESVAKEIKDAIGNLATQSATLAGGKFGADAKAIEAGNNSKYGSFEKMQSEMSGVQTGQSAAQMHKLQEFANNPKGLEKIQKEMNSQKAGSGDAFIEPFKGKKGQELLNAMAEQKATVFTGSNAIAGGGAQVFSGAFDSKGNATGRVSGGFGVTVDNASKEIGKSTTYDNQNREDIHGALESVVGKENADAMMEGWDRFKETLGGIAVVGAGAGYMLKKKKNNQSSTADPSLKKNQNVGTANASVVSQDINSGDINSPSNNLPNDSTNSKGSQPPKTIAEQIDNQTKFNKENDLFQNRKNEQLLNNPGNDTVAKRLDMEEAQMKQKFHQPMDTPHVGGGSWKTKLAMLLAPVIGASASEDVGNFLNAIDPAQLVMGQDLGAGSDVQQGNQQNISAIPTAPALAAFQGATTPIAQQMNQTIATSNDTNMQTLSQPIGNTAQMQSIGGNVSVGQSNQGMMRINGHQTKVPYSNFQSAMANNPDMMQNFSQAVSGSDMSQMQGGFDSDNMGHLITEMHNKTNIQDFSNARQTSMVNDIQSNISEIMDLNESMSETVEEIVESNQHE